MSEPGSRTLAAGWRCDACGYSLEGLPDRAEESQCPECGHTGRPVGAPTASPGIWWLAGINSVIGAVAAAAFLALGWTLLTDGGEDRRVTPIVLLGAGTGMAYAAIAAWMAPRGRWPFVRWTAAVLPALLVVASALALLSSPRVLYLAILAYSASAVWVLIVPELASWRRRAGRRE